MNILFWLLLGFSILCLLHFCLIISYSGIGATFSEFWLAAGIVSGFFSILSWYILQHNIRVNDSFLRFLIIIMIIGFCIFAFIEVTLIRNRKQVADPGMDYIIILGAQIKGTKITKSLAKRLDTALSYLRANPETIAIVSGGKGEKETISEAEAMKHYLQEKGIAKHRIIKEDKSRNTFENIRNSKILLKENSMVAIVTNGFHLYRSIRIAKKQGLIKVQGQAAPTDRVLAVNYYVREAVGVLKDKLMGNI